MDFPKFEDVQVWLFKAGIHERWHKVIAQATVGIGSVVVLATVLAILKGLLGELLPSYQREPGGGSKEVSNPGAHIAPIKPSIEDAPYTSINASNSNLPCGNPGDFSPKDDTHQREAWNLLEETLAKMQREKKKGGINMRLIEEARHDWDKGQSAFEVSCCSRL